MKTNEEKYEEGIIRSINEKRSKSTQKKQKKTTTKKNKTTSKENYPVRRKEKTSK